MPANYVLIREVTLNASAASVTFSGIPQSGYTDLKVVVSARSDQASSSGQDVYVRFNGDSASNYSFRRLFGNGSSASSDAVSSSATAGRIGRTTSNDATSNTFASTEFYIPNYTSSTAKSISGDAVDETNATAAIAQMTATIWTGTSAITSMQLFPFSSGTNFVAGSSFSLYGIAAFGVTPTVVPHASGGDVITNDGTYWIHQFYSSGTFIPNKALNCDYLVVAGGGGTKSVELGGGGGGAGGFLTSNAQSLSASTQYAITVGAGGSLQTSGNNSSFGVIASASGGGKGAAETIVGATGGSGGGGAHFGNATGYAGTPGQGSAGGNGYTQANYAVGGGGGGASAVGSNGTLANGGGNGGNGTASSLSGTSITYAGGGGGGAYNGTQSTGGSGGGGAGGRNGGAAISGTVNTGGGAGGAGQNGTGGNGGSGIVIIRYPMA